MSVSCVGASILAATVTAQQLLRLHCDAGQQCSLLVAGWAAALALVALPVDVLITLPALARLLDRGRGRDEN